MSADYGARLFDQHAAKLAASAVSVEVARARGYVSADTKAQLEREGFAPVQRRPPALVIPVWSVLGERVGAQLRPDEPRMLGGRPVKYETRLGQRMVLDVPPAVRPHLGDPARALVVTEGPIKADAAVSAGLDCVALLGVWGWRGGNDTNGTVALPDWEYVALGGRLVVVAFDSDVMLKSQVYAALVRLSALLTHRGAVVTYAYLPHGDGGRKVGLDDWLADGNPGAVLLDMATPELRSPPGDKVTVAEVDTFDDVPDEPGTTLLDELAAFIDRFLSWTPTQRDAVALWIVHSHTVDVFATTPRLNVRSAEKQCGKTRLLELLAQLAHRARFTVSMSAAYMFRTIEATCPTLLVDEADTIFGKRAEKNHEDLRALINAGHRRGATVGRMTGEGAAMIPTEFACFCPVALAGIGRLPDTIHDRSIVIDLRRRAPGERIDTYRERWIRPVAERLARRLAAWAHRHRDALADAVPEMPDGIADRPADVWEPLLAVADEAGGDWPRRARLACVELNAVRADDDASTGVQLLSDIRIVFVDAETDRLSTVTLLERLAAIEDGPWGDWYGKPITARWLADRLKPYGVRPKVVRIGDTTHRGYERSDFEDAWARYLPNLAPPMRNTRNIRNAPGRNVTDVTSVTPAEDASASAHPTPLIDDDWARYAPELPPSSRNSQNIRNAPGRSVLDVPDVPATGADDRGVHTSLDDDWGEF